MHSKTAKPLTASSGLSQVLQEVGLERRARGGRQSASQAPLGNTFSELSVSRALARQAMTSSWVIPG